MSVPTELSTKDVWLNREAAIKRTGDMMLSGWRMLATHCPICNSALLQKELKVQCASCNMPVMTEEQYSTRAEGSAKISMTTYSDVPSAAFSSSVVSTKAASVLSEHSATVQMPAPPASLTESIAKTRKLKELDESYLSVDNFDGYYSDNDKIGATNTLEEEKKTYDLNNKKRDLVSVKLGEKMLAGWTLLAAVCPFPACYGTPLMIVKGQPITCVACDKQYRISDYDGNYEVIGEKKAVKIVENSVNKKIENGSEEEKTKKITESKQEPEFLSPLFDMSEAPILDFSTFSSSSEDPSLLISKIHCVACGFKKGTDGKVICAGSAAESASISTPISLPLPLPVSVQASSSTVLPVRSSNVRGPSRNLDRTVLDNSSRLLLKRKDQNINDDDDDDDDDEDAEDSMAYSKYVQDRLNGQEKTSSTLIEKEKREVGRYFEDKKSPAIAPMDTVLAGRSGRVLTALLTKMEMTTDLLELTQDPPSITTLADCIRSLADAARSVKRLRDGN